MTKITSIDINIYADMEAVNKRIKNLIDGRSNIMNIIRHACEDSMHTAVKDDKLTIMSCVDYKSN